MQKGLACIYPDKQEQLPVMTPPPLIPPPAPTFDTTNDITEPEAASPQENTESRASQPIIQPNELQW